MTILPLSDLGMAHRHPRRLHGHLQLACWLMTVLAISACPGADAPPGIVLSGESNRPEMSTFALGEEVVLTFHVTTQPASPPPEGLKLAIRLVDEFERPLANSELPVAFAADGTAQVAWHAPSAKQGFYRAYARLSNGVELAKLRTRPAGFLTYCVVPDPAGRQLYPDSESHFGMSGGFSAKVNILPYLGVRWVYGGLRWASAEKDRPGQIEVVEQHIEDGDAYDLPRFRWAHLPGGAPGSWTTYAIATMHKIPDWAGISITPDWNKAIRPEAEAAWVAYCRRAAIVFAKAHPDQTKRQYQLTWEPMYPWGYKGTDEQLVRIYELAYPAIHAGDPHALVMGPTCSGMDLGWHTRLFQKGLGKYIDAFSIHPYKAGDPESSGLIESLRDLKALIREYCGRDLPCYGTEQGYATNEEQAQEIPQARGQIRSNLIMLGEGYRVNYAFYIHDYPGEPGYGFYYNLHPTAGHGTPLTGPKPVAPAYAAMTKLIDGHEAIETIEWLGDRIHGYVFQRDQEVILALWDYSGQNRRIILPIGVPSAVVYDWMGNATESAAPDGGLALTLSEEPCYIKLAAGARWGKDAHRLLTLATGGSIAYPGTTLTVRGRFAPDGLTAEARQAKLTIAATMADPIGRTISASVQIDAAAGAAEFAVPFQLPIALTPGRYPLTISLEAAGRQLYATGMLADVRAPVAIDQVRPSFNAAAELTGMTVQLREMRGKRTQGTCTVAIAGIPDSVRQAAFTLDVGQSLRLDLPGAIPITQRFLNYTAECRLETADGYADMQRTTVSFLTAQRFAQPPRLDGDLAEWAGRPAMHIAGRQHVVRSPEYFTGKQEVDCWMGWDAQFLYLAADVLDPVFMQPFDGFLTWKADCIQLDVDLDVDRPYEGTGNVLADTRSRRVSEIDLALTPKGPELYRTVTFDPAVLPMGLIGGVDGCELVVHREGDRTRYEARIPWSSLGSHEAPRADMAVGIAASFNDCNDTQQLNSTGLGMFTLKKPQKFGRMVLLP